MGQPAAKQGDQILASDTHVVLVPEGGVLVAKPITDPFAGPLSGELSRDVKIMGKPAAVVGSTADNTPPHLAKPPAAKFQKEPSNKGTVQSGSQTVKINGKPAARDGDPAVTCNDPVDQAVGKVKAAGTVMLG
jgi:uncharacterized Zn-binding protein involved in type VI secretion